MNSQSDLLGLLCSCSWKWNITVAISFSLFSSTLSYSVVFSEWWGFVRLHSTVQHNAELFIKEAKTTPAFPNKSRNYVTPQSQSNDIFENHECHRWFFPVVFFLTLLILTNVYINNNRSKNPIKKSSYSLYINFSWQVFVSSAL